MGIFDGWGRKDEPEPRVRLRKELSEDSVRGVARVIETRRNHMSVGFGFSLRDTAYTDFDTYRVYSPPLHLSEMVDYLQGVADTLPNGERLRKYANQVYLIERVLAELADALEWEEWEE